MFCELIGIFLAYYMLSMYYLETMFFLDEHLISVDQLNQKKKKIALNEY